MKAVAEHCVHEDHAQLVLRFAEALVNLTMALWCDDDDLVLFGPPDAEAQPEGGFNGLVPEGGFFWCGYFVKLKELSHCLRCDIFWHRLCPYHN